MRKNNPCHRCSPAALQRSAGPPRIRRIRLLIDAACAARAGSGQMPQMAGEKHDQQLRLKFPGGFQQLNQPTP